MNFLSTKSALSLLLLSTINTVLGVDHGSTCSSFDMSGACVPANALTNNNGTKIDAIGASLSALADVIHQSLPTSISKTTKCTESDDNDDDVTNSTETTAKPTPVPFPAMPSKIRAILHEDWDVLDPEGSRMLNSFSGIDGLVEFAHASTTFFDHLKGTFGILAAWDQPEEVRRCGMVHTGYSGDLFQFYLFDSNRAEDRADLASIIGEKSEELVYRFGTVDRGALCQFKQAVDGSVAKPACPSSNTTVVHRAQGSGYLDVTTRDAANILMVTIADYLDQMVDTNGWRDHHQHQEGGKQLYPGDGRPALGFYWFSSICNAIKDHLEVVPTVFNHCQDVLDKKHEVQARELYWKVTVQEKALSEPKQLSMLHKATKLNPFVAEPHVLLAQIYYRQEKHHQAALEARQALLKFYSLASNWDKRRSYGHWVGFARVLLLRSNRRMEGDYYFPAKAPEDPLYVNHNEMKLTSLRDMNDEMKAREE